MPPAAPRSPSTKGAPVYVALLRGINVGGNRMISMEKLRTLFAALGHRDVQTYVQSGNVVFRAKGASAEQVAASLQRRIEKDFGYENVDVMLRTPQELAAVLAANPFPEFEAEPKKLMVLFLKESADPSQARAAAAAEAQVHPERFRFRGREVYLYFAAGAARSKLGGRFLEKWLPGPGTARNWNSVRKLHELAAALEAGPAGR